MKKAHILVIEDNGFLRNGIASLLKAEGDIRVTATVAKGVSLARVKALKPDVILLDMSLSDRDSLDVVETIRTKTKIKIIVMGLIPLQSEVLEFVRAGASAFVLKDATPEDFVRTVKRVARGEKILPPPLTGSLFSQIAEKVAKKRGGRIPEAVRMTKRERQIVDLIAEGLSNKDIAARLNVATYTVKSHVHNVLEKLALHTRLEIASYVHTDRMSRTDK